MAEIPNLAGKAPKELVESIGTGRYSADYINWARTMNLLHEYAPGWMPETVMRLNEHGHPESSLWPAPVGATLMIRYVHVDGTVTPAQEQAVMDNRNNAIPFDRITARDVTDTKRRGSCMAAAVIFGLAHELWAKMPLESGYPEAQDEKKVVVPNKDSKAPDLSHKLNATEEVTETDFRNQALELGLTTFAIDALVERVQGKFDVGVDTLSKKTKLQIENLNKQYQPKKTTAADW
jgi:hypothetical protein